MAKQKQASEEMKKQAERAGRLRKDAKTLSGPQRSQRRIKIRKDVEEAQDERKIKPAGKRAQSR